MATSETLDYVKAAARVLDLPLGDAAAQRVAEHFERTAAMARLLDAAELAPEHELAEVFRPAPFPPGGTP
jgi:hypothetical protein